MDLNRLTKGEKLAGISSLVLFLASFIPLWASRGYEAGVDLPGGFETKANLNAWSGYGLTMSIALLLALVVGVLVLAKAAGALDRTNMPVPVGLIYAGAGALILLIMLFSVLTGPEGVNEADLGFGAKYVNDRGLMLFVGILLAAGVAVGGFLHMQEEGSTPKGVGGSPSAPPPGPPGT